jgi:hypothetical protein
MTESSGHSAESEPTFELNLCMQLAERYNFEVFVHCQEQIYLISNV